MKDNKESIGGNRVRYIKFDSEEYDSTGRVSICFFYPSIVEVLCSALIRNSDIQSMVRCADHYFVIRNSEVYEECLK